MNWQLVTTLGLCVCILALCPFLEAKDGKGAEERIREMNGYRSVFWHGLLNKTGRCARVQIDGPTD